MGGKKHCSVETRILIVRSRNESKSYKFIQIVLQCSAKMEVNALRWQEKPETRSRKKKLRITITK